MRVACQTLIFGTEYDDTSTMLDVVQQAGFLGVEIAQFPYCLYQGNYDRLRNEATARGLEVLGFSGGSLTTRRSFIEACPDRQPYLFCGDVEWGDIQKAVEDGFRVALHPHAFKRVHNMEDAEKILNGDGWKQKILLSPDTAHYHIVGDDVGRAIRSYAHRLAAIHLKDWRSLFGRVSHRYAKGFTELGRGDVQLDELVQFLRQPEQKDIWDGTWAVYEQDYTHSSPEHSLGKSAGWLRKKGFDLNESRRAMVPAKWPPESKNSPSTKAEAKLGRLLRGLVSGDYGRFYRRLAEGLGEIYYSPLVVISTRSASHDSFGLLAHWAQGEGERAGNSADPLLAREFSGPRICTLDELEKDLPGSPTISESKAKGATHVLTVPIANEFNPQHIRFVVHIFGGPYAEDNDSSPLDQIAHSELAAQIVQAADANLDDFCRVTAALTSVEGRRDSGKAELQARYERLHDVITKQVRAGACSILRYDALHERLVPVYAPELKWFGAAANDPGRQFYELEGNSLTSIAWKKRLPYIIPDVAKHKKDTGWEPRSEERIGKDPQVLEQRSTMFVPIVASAGERLGVVRCVKCEAGRPFSDDDVAIVEAALEEAIPGIRLLEEAIEREERHSQLRHELKGPLTSIRNIFDSLKALVPYWEKSADSPLVSYDVVGDGFRWAELAITLVDRLRYNQDILPPVRAQKAVRLEGLTAAVVKNLWTEFRRYGLAESVNYWILHLMPPLHVDPAMFQEILFNLIGNAIKYHDHQRDRYPVMLAWHKTDDSFVIKVRDNGKGVRAEVRDRIFERGFRDARRSDEEGEGYGLWIVRRLVEAHGGRIELTNLRLPTEFTIMLPTWLAERAPNTQ